MTRLPSLALIAWVAFVGTANAQVPELSEHPVLRSEATVTDDVVRIGDVIDHAGVVAKIPIFRSPDLGSTGTVSADAVIEAVRKHALIGLDTAGISEVTVTRLARPIAPQEIEACISEALARQFNIADSGDISLFFDRDLRTINVDQNARGAIRAENVSYDARSGRFDATLDIPTGATSRGQVRFTGRAAVTTEVAMLVRPLDRGDIIKQDDIVIQRRPKSQVTSTIVTDVNQAVGMAARTSIQPDRPLRTSDLMKPELVQRNQQVTLIYQVPGIMLTVRGKAAESGAEGDLITVLNEQTKRPVQGIVIGPGHVVVGGSNPQLAANGLVTAAR